MNQAAQVSLLSSPQAFPKGPPRIQQALPQAASKAAQRIPQKCLSCSNPNGNPPQKTCSGKHSYKANRGLLHRFAKHVANELLEPIQQCNDIIACPKPAILQPKSCETTAVVPRRRPMGWRWEIGNQDFNVAEFEEIPERSRIQAK